MSPTDCDTVLRDLELFLDGELPDADCLGIEEHLSRCAGCLSHYEFRRRLQVIIATRCQESVPASLLERVRRVVAEPPAG